MQNQKGIYEDPVWKQFILSLKYGNVSPCQENWNRLQKPSGTDYINACKIKRSSSSSGRHKYLYIKKKRVEFCRRKKVKKTNGKVFTLLF